MSEQAYVFPAPGGSVEIRPVADSHAAIMVFDHGYGSREFARGPLISVTGRAMKAIEEGITFGPVHEPGAPIRWFHFPHDDSYRSSVHDGEVRVFSHKGMFVGVHGRQDGCTLLGHKPDLPQITAHVEKMVQGSEDHVPMAVHHQGRRRVLKFAGRVDEVVALQVDASTRYAVTLTGKEQRLVLGVERTVDDERRTIKEITANEVLEEILWSDTGSKNQPDLHASPMGTCPSGPLPTEKADALEAAIRHMFGLRGAGKMMLPALGKIFRQLAADGTRVSGQGEALRVALETHGKLPGSSRVFRYAMATCRRLGLLICDGTLESFAFDDLYDPASEFARHLMSQFGTTERQGEAAGVPNDLRAPSPEPPDLRASTSEPRAPTPDLRPPPPAQASIPVDLWPYSDDTSDSSECTPLPVVANTHKLVSLGWADRCDPDGPGGDQVNWFGFKVDTPGNAFIFYDPAALGDQYTTKDNLPPEEFHRHVWEDADRLMKEKNA